MPVFEFNKLVRDKIPQHQREQGSKPEVVTLKGDELRQAILEKLVEEVNEYKQASTREQKLEEAADIQQTLNDLLAVDKLSLEEVEQVRANKELRKGAFRSGQYIHTVEVQEEDPWIDKLRSDPEKYPEA